MSTGSKYRIPLVLFALTMAVSGAAGAQPKRDPAAADEAFRAAVAAKLKGDTATACAKFAASMQLDPSPATLLNVAECLENEGKLARAWSETQRAKVLNNETPGEQRRRELDAYATATEQRLRKKLAWIHVALKSAPPGVTVDKDGVELPVAVLDQAIPADPGSTKVHASAPGYLPFEVTVALREGETSEVSVALSPAPPAPKATVAPSASSAPGPAPKPMWPWITGGAGVALVGVAIGFGVSEAGTQSEIDASCHDQPNGRCLAGYPYQAKNDQLYRDFGLSLGFGIAGGVALAAGVVGLIVGPGKTTTTAGVTGRGAASTGAMERIKINPYAGPGALGLTVGGAF